MLNNINFVLETAALNAKGLVNSVDSVSFTDLYNTLEHLKDYESIKLVGELFKSKAQEQLKVPTTDLDKIKERYPQASADTKDLLDKFNQNQHSTGIALLNLNIDTLVTSTKINDQIRRTAMLSELKIFTQQAEPVKTALDMMSEKANSFFQGWKFF